MKSMIRIVLALAVLAGSVSMPATYGQALSGASKAKVTKGPRLHDGCHSRYAQMRGRPCR
jgi:hypothetical protein